MNNKKKKIIVGLLAIILLAVLHLTFGVLNRFSFITAYVDLWTGNERIVIYGERFETDSLKSALAPKFGFNYERQEDCTVTAPFVQGVDDYNKIMGSKISERLGAHWDSVLEREIRKLK